MDDAHLGLAAALGGLVVVLAASALAWLAARAGWSDPRVRRTTLTGAVVAVLLLVGQALVVRAVVDGPRGPAAADLPVLRWFATHRDEYATGFAIVLAVLGGTATMSVVTLVAVVVLAYLERRKQAAVVALTGAAGGLLVLAFKAVYARPRPPRPDQVLHYRGYSLPSGHALGATVVLGIVAAAAYPALRRTRARILLVAATTTAVLLAGVSRLYLAAHWLTDVLTGWLLGGAWLTVGITALALVRLGRPAPSSTG
jgi:undecaprenyl-diphosphatase